MLYIHVEVGWLLYRLKYRVQVILYLGLERDFIQSQSFSPCRGVGHAVPAKVQNWNDADANSKQASKVTSPKKNFVTVIVPNDVGTYQLSY